MLKRTPEAQLLRNKFLGNRIWNVGGRLGRDFVLAYLVTTCEGNVMNLMMMLQIQETPLPPITMQA